MTVTIHHGDCLDVLRAMPEASVEAVVTDPPYGLSATTTGDVVKALTAWLAGEEYRKRGVGFMGRTWDAFVPGPEVWREVLRVLKPGGHAVVFAGARTADLMGMALRIAGFEIRDQLQWVTGQGFPKSLDISKAIDRMAGAEREVLVERTLNNNRFAVSGSGQDQERFRKFAGNANITAPATDAAKQWAGFGTQLKPSYEPILLCRRPLSEPTVAANVLRHAVGGLNIAATRVPTDWNADPNARGWQGGNSRQAAAVNFGAGGKKRVAQPHDAGRFPPNLLHDGSPEVLEAFGRFGERPAGVYPSARGKGGISTSGHGGQNDLGLRRTTEAGSAARYFPALGFTEDELRFHYSAKAGKADRAGSKHPTIKPVALMRWLCRLITPPGGTVLDPFAGSGTTGEAALLEGFSAVLVEREAEYVADIKARLARMQVAKPAVAPSHPDLFADETAA